MMKHVLLAFCLICCARGAEAATQARPKAVHTPTASKDFKAVCHTKVIRIQAEHWIELRRKQRCF